MSDDTLLTITIEGPSNSGKSTVARCVCKALADLGFKAVGIMDDISPPPPGSLQTLLERQPSIDIVVKQKPR